MSPISNKTIFLKNILFEPLYILTGDSKANRVKYK